MVTDLAAFVAGLTPAQKRELKALISPPRKPKGVRRDAEFVPVQVVFADGTEYVLSTLSSEPDRGDALARAGASASCMLRGKLSGYKPLSNDVDPAGWKWVNEGPKGWRLRPQATIPEIASCRVLSDDEVMDRRRRLAGPSSIDIMEGFAEEAA